MRTIARSLCLMVTTLSLALVTTAQIPDGARLPYSGGVLVARAIALGKMARPTRSALAKSNPTNITCSPAPCVLPNVRISSHRLPSNETPIVVEAGDNNDLLAGANDYNCSNVQGFFTSSDQGSTWTEHCMSNDANHFGAGDPGVARDLNGHSYITGIQFNTVGPEVTDISLQKDFGHVSYIPPLFGNFADKEWIQADVNQLSPHKNTLYISFTNFDAATSNSAIVVSHSTDGGMTFSTVLVDGPQIFPGEVDQFSDLAIAKNGTVYVSWMRCPATGPTGDCGGTTATLYISSSIDGGLTWSAPSAITSVGLAPDSCSCAFYGNLPNTFERVSEIPIIGVDNSGGPNNGRIYAAFYNWNGSYMEVDVAHSSNGGVTWSAPVRVTPTSDTHDQFFPWLNVSSIGAVGVTWLDRRDDPANVNYEAFSSVSINGGTSFQTNKLLSSAPSNPFNDGFGGFFMGDYTGNTWVGSLKLFATYCDTRNGTDCQDELVGYFF